MRDACACRRQLARKQTWSMPGYTKAAQLLAALTALREAYSLPRPHLWLIVADGACTHNQRIYTVLRARDRCCHTELWLLSDEPATVG